VRRSPASLEIDRQLSSDQPKGDPQANGRFSVTCARLRTRTVTLRVNACATAKREPLNVSQRRELTSWRARLQASSRSGGVTRCSSQRLGFSRRSAKGRVPARRRRIDALIASIAKRPDGEEVRVTYEAPDDLPTHTYIGGHGTWVASAGEGRLRLRMVTFWSHKGRLTGCRTQ
jgi:hypothetical protein